MKRIFKAILGFLGKSFSTAAENVLATLIVSGITVLGGGLFVNKVIQERGDDISGNKGGQIATVVVEPKASPAGQERAGGITLEPKKMVVANPTQADPFLAFLDKTRKKSGSKRSCAFLILKNNSRTTQLNSAITSAINNAGFQPKASFFKGDLGQYLDDFKYVNEEILSESGVADYIDCYLIGDYYENIEPHFERKNEKTIKVNFKGQIVDLNTMNTTPVEFEDIFSGATDDALSKAYAGISGEIGGKLTAIN